MIGLAAQSSRPPQMSPVLLALIVLVTSLALVSGLAWAARRLLGQPVGFVRALTGGLLGFLLSGAVGQALQRENPLAFLSISLGVTVLVAMTFIVVAEALVPTGSWPGPVGTVRTLRRRAARTRRYLQISWILMRHGLGPVMRGRRRVADASLARALRQALEEGGVTFIKLGQVLSTRRDLLPPEFVDELSQLQDQVAAVPASQVRQVLTEDLRAPPDTVFAEFDGEPVAAASIASVHRARLRSGREVAVKVQRPGIRPLVERDLDIIARLALTLERRTRWGRVVGAVELAHGFAIALREELDFRIEARNMTAVRAAGDAEIYVPALYEDLSTERVLVQEWVAGVALADAGPLIAERGIDRVGLARTLLRGMLTQILRDGVFHADPHPGNILLSRDGRLILLDFGSVGRLDAQLRTSLQDLLAALGRNDPAGMRDALLDVVAHPDDVDEQRLERALGRFMARHLSAGQIPGAEMFADLFRLVTAYGLAVLPEIAAVFRALATIEGTLTWLAPGFNVFTEARGYAAAYFATRLEPEALRQSAAAELAALLPVLRRLPRRFDRVTRALEQGRLSVNVRLFADERDRQVVTELVHQSLLTVLGVAIAIVAVLLLGTSGGPRVTATVSLYQMFGYNLLVISSVLVLRVLFTIFRSNRRSP